MKILAISQLDPTKDGTPFLQEEGQRIYELYDFGIMPILGHEDQMHFEV